MSCSLVGESQTLHVFADTLAFKSYGCDTIVERFQCNYGLNEFFRADLSDGNLQITGCDDDQNARIIEIPSHRFYLATLFLPQLNSTPAAPHPLIHAFVAAAVGYKSQQDSA